MQSHASLLGTVSRCPWISVRSADHDAVITVPADALRVPARSVRLGDELAAADLSLGERTDENKFGADNLQRLTYSLTYAYARCNRSVSLCAPAYFSHHVVRPFLHSRLGRRRS